MSDNTFSSDELEAARILLAHKAAVESGKPYWVEEHWAGGNPQTDRCLIGGQPHGEVWYGHRAMSYDASEREKRFYAALFVPYKRHTATQTFHSLEEARHWVETHEIFDPAPHDSSDYESKNVIVKERGRP